jgi:hypothetical protein
LKLKHRFMNCENCQNFLSGFLDGELDDITASHVKTHLALCAECAVLCEEFASIIGFCSEMPVEEGAPPNSQALWCRISNIIETEIKPEIEKENAAAAATATAPRPGRLALLWNRTWSLSLTQAVSAVLGVAVISSLLTVVGVKNFLQTPPNSASASVAPASLFERALSRVGVIETPQEAREKRLREQQATIEYWNRRAAERRQQWDASLRVAFDRNLSEIDQAVSEYKRTLEMNPHDEISNEMLDAALNEKMELLRQFSEL